MRIAVLDPPITDRIGGRRKRQKRQNNQDTGYLPHSAPLPQRTLRKYGFRPYFGADAVTIWMSCTNWRHASAAMGMTPDEL
jgi:hypothetical protein